MIVVLETLKIDNSDIEDSTMCRTTSSDTPTLSGYQNVSNKTFQSSYAIEEPTKFPTYKTDKKQNVIGMDQGLLNRNLCCVKLSKSGQKRFQPLQPSQLSSNRNFLRNSLDSPHCS